MYVCMYVCMYVLVGKKSKISSSYLLDQTYIIMQNRFARKKAGKTEKGYVFGAVNNKLA